MTLIPHRYSLRTATPPTLGDVSNALSILERMLPLRQPPQFWLQGLDMSSGENHEYADDDREDDWRMSFFDDRPAAPIGPILGPKSRKLRAQTLGCQFSHQARVSACWMSLIPFLSSMELSVRALGILHAIITPESRQSYMVMDWVSGCVDYGVQFEQLVTVHGLS